MRRVYIVLLTFFLVGLVLVSGLYIASYLIGRGLASQIVPTPVLSVQEATLEESGQARLGLLPSLVDQPAECVLIGNEPFTEGTAFIADNELRVDLIDM
ncbi:MAG: hypothetical protein RLZZ70_138, partial [Candidatus Parcubacteria bacterium]